MKHDLTLHELTASPNNVKVRVALGYKGLEYERKPVQFDSFPGVRERIVALSRQPRLPVLQHGTTIVFDSAAILRYLEANFPGTPRLFVDDYEGHGEIERWELFSKTRISEPIGMLFGQAFVPEPDPAIVESAGAMLHARTGAIEDALRTGDFLVGDRLTAADVVCASSLYLADLTEAHDALHPIAAFFRRSLTFGEGREKTRAWTRRVLAYDPVIGKR